ncbi:MAG: hypothetical protein VX546_08870 [Myxococcota bacterium]|nr:hypothetical protein [Myxococcota bacterium]
MAALDRFGADLVSVRSGMEAVLDAAEEYPRCPLLQVYAATLHLYAQDAAGQRSARALLDRAAALSGAMNPRERLSLAAAEAWWSGDFEAAAERLEALTAQWPGDLVALKACEFLYYVMGQHWSGARFLAHVERVAEANADSGPFFGIWGFAAELCGQRARAFELANRALALSPDDAWTHHTLAHAYLMEGRAAEGRGALQPCLEGWGGAAPSIRGHNTWHLALFSVVLADPEPAAVLYRDRLAVGESAGVGELIDAISLLWWLEHAGAPQDEAWSRLLPPLLPHVRDLAFPFAAAHFAMALSRAGEREALAVLQADVREQASRHAGERRRAWEVGVPLVDACAAFGTGNAPAGCEALSPVIEEVGRVGGSDAQDAVFRYALVRGLAEAGRGREARAQAEALCAGRPVLPFEERWL